MRRRAGETPSGRETGRQITPQETIEASAEDLARVGIDYRSSDLLTGFSRSDSQAPPVHFGLARLTDATLPFWRDYRLSSGRVTDILNLLAVRLQRPDERLDFDALAEAHGWSREVFDRVVDTIRRRELADKRVFRNIQGGVVGHEWLLDESFTQTEDRFIAYAASEPLRLETDDELPARDADPAAQIRHHRAHYATILMTVAVATERGLPTVTHFGIFRNPMAFLDPDEAHRNLAMRLHGFAAAVELHALSGKQFLVTEPMPVMTRILSRELEPDDVFEGTGDDEVLEYLNRNLPPEIAPIRQGERYSWAGFTLDARQTVIRLRALARYYHPTATD